MNRCVFCGIVAREIKASLVYEDEEFLAFLDLFPVHPGHTLVVPKRHVPDLASCEEDLVEGSQLDPLNRRSTHFFSNLSLPSHLAGL